MINKVLHIINGDSLTEQVEELGLPGEIVVWRELLCEGPCDKDVGSPKFIEQREKFLKEAYDISAENYKERFVSQLKRLKAAKDYDHVVLWFEFDLFCHINMLAAISFYLEHKPQVPFYLVCSKRLKGENEFLPLSSLSEKNLLNHFKHKIELKKEDLEIASLVWELYCGSDPMKLKKQIKKTSNFEYLSSCIRAHIERFPNSRTGINSLEKNVLKLVENQHITSNNQLLGYALQYQGYYGYSDSQMERVLNKLSIFYTIENERLILTQNGLDALEKKKNFYRELMNDEYYGGAKIYDFLYDSDSHKVLKL
ncbi:protein of unknown function [Salegentibacter holothuriorum]|uniref:DUF1835 domain-containing protein n=1 Tax=Salegentibacter holothuriorum TaxID=241145 RepID=A0A1T5AC27_9FLAO|nr:DUF1835 domain-containing protein [Salegentibacter holothuriorum]SKB32551.1 protein of unknown function [Salegentibacter holothuriorum]